MFFIAMHMILTSLLIPHATGALTVPRLSLHISGPSMVAGIENLKLTTIITNTGDKTLRLLTDPDSLLNTVPTNKFTIRNVAGETPLFIGSLVHSILDDAILGENENLIILSPGKSINVEHDLSKAYDFAYSGPGLYTFEARNLFYHVESSASNFAPIPIYAQTVAHEAIISSALAVRKGAKRFTPTTELASRRSPTFVDCNISQESVVSNAIIEATLELTDAVRYMQAYTVPATRYTTWFGGYSEGRWTKVRTIYEEMYAKGFPAYSSPYTFNCTCTGYWEGGLSYVRPHTNPGVIHLCPAYWKRPLKGTISQTGILIHEASHFLDIGATLDFQYGVDSCKKLAKIDPTKAVSNADSYQFFVENYPPLE